MKKYYVKIWEAGSNIKNIQDKTIECTGACNDSEKSAIEIYKNGSTEISDIVIYRDTDFIVIEESK